MIFSTVAQLQLWFVWSFSAFSISSLTPVFLTSTRFALYIIIQKNTANIDFGFACADKPLDYYPFEVFPKALFIVQMFHSIPEETLPLGLLIIFAPCTHSHSVFIWLALMTGSFFYHMRDNFSGSRLQVYSLKPSFRIITWSFEDKTCYWPLSNDDWKFGVIQISILEISFNIVHFDLEYSSLSYRSLFVWKFFALFHQIFLYRCDYPF